MKEMLSIYDDEGREAGISSREEAHRLGLWHEVVHCWMYGKTGDQIWIYFQQRAHTKKDFPDYYDLTSTGHVDAGEAHRQAVIREAREETGVIIDPKHLTYLGSVKEETHEGDFFDREIGRVYGYRMDIPFFSPGEEVDRIVAVSMDEYEKKELGFAPYIQGYTLEGEPILIRAEEWCRHEGEYASLIKPILTNLLQVI